MFDDYTIGRYEIQILGGNHERLVKTTLDYEHQFMGNLYAICCANGSFHTNFVN